MKVEKQKVIIDDQNDLSIPITEESSDFVNKENEGKEWARNKLDQIQEMEEAVNTMFLTGDSDNVEVDLEGWLKQ